MYVLPLTMLYLLFYCHLRTIAQLCRAISSQLRHISTVGKKLLNSNTSSTCPHNMVNFGPLAAKIGSLVWGAPANFNGFCVLAALLQRHRSTEANQSLHDVWPSPALVHCIYIFGGSFSVTEFCQVQNSLCVQVLRSPILAAILHGTRLVGVSQTLWRSTEAPPIFGRAAITLGIGPHSSCVPKSKRWNHLSRRYMVNALYTVSHSPHAH